MQQQHNKQQQQTQGQLTAASWLQPKPGQMSAVYTHHKVVQAGCRTMQHFTQGSGASQEQGVLPVCVLPWELEQQPAAVKEANLQLLFCQQT
jgi:hypothetical protein